MAKTSDKQMTRQNNWIKENRERVTISFPLGTKERIMNSGAKSLNNYIYELVMNDLEKRENTRK